MIILKEEIHTATKDYPCSACEWFFVDDFLSDPKSYGVTFADMRILVNIRKDNYMIKKGMRYLYQVGIYDSFYAVKARIDANEICNKYHINEE